MLMIYYASVYSARYDRCALCWRTLYALLMFSGKEARMARFAALSRLRARRRTTSARRHALMLYFQDTICLIAAIYVITTTRDAFLRLRHRCF